MKKILIPIGCRSDEGLSAPIIRRLEKEDWCEVHTVKLEAQNFIASYQIMDYHTKCCRHIGKWDPVKPDLVIIVGDRVEMTAAACAAFHNNVPIAHVYAGIINDPVTTYDDIDRHCITLWSDIQFVESEDAYLAVTMLKHNLGLDINKVFFVGITHLDDMEIDESKVPNEYCRTCADNHKKEYDLILYNTPTISSDTEKEVKEITKCLLSEEKYQILIGGNPDGTSESVLWREVDQGYENLPRSQFLGLLKNCSRFITNSSAAIYEAPYFLKPDQIIMIGDRNRNRPPVKCEPGGSDRIVGILKEYLK